MNDRQAWIAIYAALIAKRQSSTLEEIAKYADKAFKEYQKRFQ